MSYQEQLSFHSESTEFETASRISEISMPGNTSVSRTLIAGMLLELSASSDQRWVCWVGERPLKPLLDAGAQLRGKQILQVVSNKSDNLIDITSRALSSGKSHTVALLSQQVLTENQRKAIDMAAQKGNSECLIIYFND